MSRPFSKAQLSAAAERQQLLKQALPLFESNLIQAEVAPLLGISAATLSRLLNLCAVRGNFARKALAKCRRLVKLPVERLAPKLASGGTESQFATLLKLPAVLKQLRRLYRMHRAKGHAQTVCRVVALQELGYSRQLLDLPPLGRKLRAGSQPKPLMEYLKREFKPQPAPQRRHNRTQN